MLPHTDIYNIYGPTEATIWVSSWRCNGGDFEGVATSPIGPPLANTQLYVLDEQLHPVPVGELLCVSCVSGCHRTGNWELGVKEILRTRPAVIATSENAVLMRVTKHVFYICKGAVMQQCWLRN